MALVLSCTAPAPPMTAPLATAADTIDDRPAATLHASAFDVDGDFVYLVTIAPGGAPYRNGNLKKYRLAADGDGPRLLDARGAGVLDREHRFRDDARSLWSTAADGGEPLAGGAAAQLAGSAPLNRFTFLPRPDSGGRPVRDRERTLFERVDLEPDNTDPRLARALGAGGIERRERILRAVSDGLGGLGAPLHTTPLPIRYQEAGDIVLLPASDGFLHAFDAASGHEIWAWIPRQLLDRLRHVVEGTATTAMHGLDGPMTIDHRDRDGDGVIDPGERAVLVVGMGRGGRNYYALDIGDRGRPRLLWEILGGRAPYQRLGQTWSRALPATMMLDGTVRHVLLFGGGYDPARTGRHGRRRDDAVGNAIYVVAAGDGALLRQVSADPGADLRIDAMGNAIAADLQALDLDGDSHVDRLYGAGTGGRIFRIDLVDGILHGGVIADLDGAAGRMFFRPPEVAWLARGGTASLVLLIGSGNRAEPLSGGNQDRFYMIRDRNPWPQPGPAGGRGQPGYRTIDESTLRAAGGGHGRGADAGRDPQTPADGWYIDLGRQRKVLAPATVFDHIVFFTTFTGRQSAAAPGTIPLAGSEGRLHAVSLLDGSASFGRIDEHSAGEAQESSSRLLSFKTIPGRPRVVPVDGPGEPPSAQLAVRVGLEQVARWTNRFHRLYWEEVFR